MKSLSQLLIFLITSMTLVSCMNFYDEGQQPNSFDENSSINLTTRSSEDFPPFNLESISFANADTIVSENSDYIAYNITFSSDYAILASRFLDENEYGEAVEVWQNLVRVKNKQTNNEVKFIVSLIPDTSYYSIHKFIDWSDFKHLEKNTDFTGYEIRTDWETGMIQMANYYQNGKCLYRVDANGEVKIDFIKSILNQFYLTKINLIEKFEDTGHTEEEEYEYYVYDPEKNCFVRKIGVISWIWIERHGVDDQDHGDLPEDGSGITGTGTQPGTIIVSISAIGLMLV